MKRKHFFYSGIILLLIGISIIGYAIGRLTNYTLEGTLIGTGIGLIISGILFSRTYRRLSIFEKEEL